MMTKVDVSERAEQTRVERLRRASGTTEARCVREDAMMKEKMEQEEQAALQSANRRDDSMLPRQVGSINHPKMKW
jgi:hypothetical protein